MLGWHKCSSDSQGQNSSVDNSCSNNKVACLFESVVTMEYMVYYNFFACVLVPLLLMFGIYLKIFMAARRQLKQMENNMVHGERSCSILQKEVHAAKSLAIIVGLFAVCWLPLHIINCVILFCPLCMRAPPYVMYLAIILSHANSVVNPLIYAYRIREFRHTFRKIIGQHIMGKKEQFKPATASRRTSVHDGDAEHSSIRISTRARNFYTSRDSGSIHAESDLGKNVALEWHQNGNMLDGEANGHIPHSCNNGDLLNGPSKTELLSKEYVGLPITLASMEASPLEASDVS